MKNTPCRGEEGLGELRGDEEVHQDPWGAGSAAGWGI